MSPGSKRLVDDHLELHQLLAQLRDALDHSDVQRTYAKLDLFWARLAVHIRAEHLHLFPSLVKLPHHAETDSTPSLKEMQAVIKQLREDHDFFMHELSGAVLDVRALLNAVDNQIVQSELRQVRDTITEVEHRLESHDEIEEGQVYLWVSSLLNQKEQSELAVAINTELENRPARFAATTFGVE